MFLGSICLVDEVRHFHLAASYGRLKNIDKKTRKANTDDLPANIQME